MTSVGFNCTLITMWLLDQWLLNFSNSDPQEEQLFTKQAGINMYYVCICVGVCAFMCCTLIWQGLISNEYLLDVCIISILSACILMVFCSSVVINIHQDSQNWFRCSTKLKESPDRKGKRERGCPFAHLRQNVCTCLLAEVWGNQM